MKSLIDILKPIAQKVGLIADYVIETGTDSFWEYEKWASGKVICRGTTSITVTTWTAWGSLYEGTPCLGQTAFPIGLFIEAPHFKVTLTGTVGMFPETYLTLTKDKTPMIYPVRPTSTSSSPVNYHMEAIGRWK